MQYGAAEVASIGDGDPEIAQGAPERIRHTGTSVEGDGREIGIRGALHADMVIGPATQSPETPGPVAWSVVRRRRSAGPEAEQARCIHATNQPGGTTGMPHWYL